MRLFHAIGHALTLTGTMTWQILWALIFGFAAASVIQALVRRSTIVRRLGDDRPRTIALATGFGIASSSCSYAAVALARTLYRQGASLSAAMAFEIASTNLVVELGVVLAVLIGWQFTAAEFVGGPIMIVLVAVAFRLFVRDRLLREARTQANRGRAGSMEGHAAMDMSIAASGSLWRRLRARGALTSVSQIFVMEWAAVIRDIAVGLLLAGAVGAWVPTGFWRDLFVSNHPLAEKFVGPLIGPIVSVLSSVCSVGNVPLAAVLWTRGIGFGGVVAFVFADLIILPILVIYRKYYGTRTAFVIFGTFYLSMVVAAFLVELIFGGLGIIPSTHRAHVVNIAVRWNYTSFLDIVAILVALVLCFVFVRSGALPMLREMGGEPMPSDESATTVAPTE